MRRCRACNENPRAKNLGANSPSSSSQLPSHALRGPSLSSFFDVQEDIGIGRRVAAVVLSLIGGAGASSDRLILAQALEVAEVGLRRRREGGGERRR